MRCVPFDAANFEYPDGWEERARVASEEIAHIEATSPENLSIELRKEKYHNIWSELKLPLSKVFHNKCWYTECLQVGTDTDIDHFRPKLSVKDCKNPITGEKHHGYWWLAFKPSNYKYSCIVANRRRRDIETGIPGGKADEFPLWSEDSRAWTPDDIIADELPLLIDPCHEDEVAYITFSENGEAIEKYTKEEREKAYMMAHSSICLYNLNHSDFVKERVKIRIEINRNIEIAKYYYRKLNSPSPEAENAYRESIKNLRNARKEESPFSSFAVAYLDPLRGEEYLNGVFQ